MVLRALCAAFYLAVSALPARAHGLPETNITISTGGGDLVFTVAIPVPELELAMQGALADASGPVPSADAAKLADYFAAHLAVDLTAVGPLNMRLRGASVQDAHTADTGHFDLITLDFAAPLPMDIGIFPMAIAFDAVMHHVRNHRANVFWVRTDGETPVPMGQFMFDQKLGKTAPLTLNPAP